VGPLFGFPDRPQGRRSLPDGASDGEPEPHPGTCGGPSRRRRLGSSRSVTRSPRANCIAGSLLATMAAGPPRHHHEADPATRGRRRPLRGARPMSRERPPDPRPAPEPRRDSGFRPESHGIQAPGVPTDLARPQSPSIAHFIFPRGGERSNITHVKTPTNTDDRNSGQDRRSALWSESKLTVPASLRYRRPRSFEPGQLTGDDSGHLDPGWCTTPKVEFGRRVTLGHRDPQNHTPRNRRRTSSPPPRRSPQASPFG